MRIYLPSKQHDLIIIDSVQSPFILICSADINLVKKCIDYTVFCDTKCKFDSGWRHRLSDNNADYLIRPSAGFFIGNRPGFYEGPIIGKIIKSKQSFQEYMPGFEFTIRISFEENEKAFGSFINFESKNKSKYGERSFFLDME